MSTQTSRLSLVKPAYTDAADIAVINSNMDKIDAVALHIYPVGSIYMSVSSTSPATLFGGTWQQLQNRFLIGASSTYAVNATGGATSVSYTPVGSNSGGAVGNTTLTINQIPSHNHTFTGGTGLSTGSASVSHTHSGETNEETQYHKHGTTAHHHGITGVNAYQIKKVSSADGTIQQGTNAKLEETRISFNTEDGGGNKSTGDNTRRHTHTFTTDASTATAHTHTYSVSGTIGNKGGGQAHGHGFTQPSFTGTAATIATMPPYLAVYMWKRTA